MSVTTDDIWRRLDGLAKPPRSLGCLEELAARLCAAQGTLSPQTFPRRLVVFAADHGVARSGVTIWPASVTSLVVQAMCSGKAASTVLAQQTQTDVVIVNVGTFDKPQCKPPQGSDVVYHDRRIAAGTRNLAEEPALTEAEFQRAWDIGAHEAIGAARDRMRVVLVGDMGIGNTTPAACLATLLANVPLAEAVGRGAGADDQTLDRKRCVVRQAAARARALQSANPRAAIASIAGFEIAAMAGFFAAAHAQGLTILLDGAIAGAAALVAETQSPGVSDSMIAAHLSTEPSHCHVLRRLGLTPFLDWRLRLGEGTGALLLLPLLDAAAAILGQMATMDDLGVSSTDRA
jgi:nicotinate-nucleotide--dimethylbenzimidazole phosphoribosyltransferase